MTTIAKLAIASAVAMLPFTASAKSHDTAYCATLSELYRKTAALHQDPTVTVPLAMAKCAAGDSADSIPVLEQALKNQGITLPPRT